MEAVKDLILTEAIESTWKAKRGRVGEGICEQLKGKNKKESKRKKTNRGERDPCARRRLPGRLSAGTPLTRPLRVRPLGAAHVTNRFGEKAKRVRVRADACVRSVCSVVVVVVRVVVAFAIVVVRVVVALVLVVVLAVVPGFGARSSLILSALALLGREPVFGAH